VSPLICCPLRTRTRSNPARLACPGGHDPSSSRPTTCAHNASAPATRICDSRAQDARCDVGAEARGPLVRGVRSRCDREPPSGRRAGPPPGDVRIAMRAPAASATSSPRCSLQETPELAEASAKPLLSRFRMRTLPEAHVSDAPAVIANALALRSGVDRVDRSDRAGRQSSRQELRSRAPISATRKRRSRRSRPRPAAVSWYCRPALSR